MWARLIPATARTRARRSDVRGRVSPCERLERTQLERRYGDRNRRARSPTRRRPPRSLARRSAALRVTMTRLARRSAVQWLAPRARRQTPARWPPVVGAHQHHVGHPVSTPVLERIVEQRHVAARGGGAPCARDAVGTLNGGHVRVEMLVHRCLVATTIAAQHDRGPTSARDQLLGHPGRDGCLARAPHRHVPDTHRGNCGLARRQHAGVVQALANTSGDSVGRGQRGQCIAGRAGAGRPVEPHPVDDRTTAPRH